MHPLQQPANFAPSVSTGFLSHFPEPLDAAASMLDAIAPNVEEEFLFPVDDITMHRHNVTANLEEQSLMAAMPDFMCIDNYWQDPVTLDGNDNAEALDIWDAFVEVTSQSQTLNDDASSSAMSPAYFSSENSGTNLADMNTAFVQPSPVYSEASSFAAYQHDSHSPYTNNHVNEPLDITPCTHSNSTNSATFLSGETSGTYLPNTNTSFIHPSPVYSEASSFPTANQHDPFYMRDHTNDHVDMHMGIHRNATNSVCASILPNFVHGNVPMTYSGSATSIIATSDVDVFDNQASSFVTFASPPAHELNLAIAGTSRCALNLASRPQLNSEAGTSPLHEASCPSMNTARANRNPSDREARGGKGVSILIESSKLAIDDGYVWRKYGQKGIKNKAHPRAYFRCAQPNCCIKKQTEHSSDKEGFVLITYYGSHNH